MSQPAPMFNARRNSLLYTRNEFTSSWTDPHSGRSCSLVSIELHPLYHRRAGQKAQAAAGLMNHRLFRQLVIEQYIVAVHFAGRHPRAVLENADLGVGDTGRRRALGTRFEGHLNIR